MFKVGDWVRCLKYIKFSDGWQHFVGQAILIEKDTVAYYNNINNSDNYELVTDV